jgi:hypothetical protein
VLKAHFCWLFLTYPSADPQQGFPAAGRSPSEGIQISDETIIFSEDRRSATLPFFPRRAIRVTTKF